MATVTIPPGSADFAWDTGENLPVNVVRVLQASSADFAWGTTGSTAFKRTIPPLSADWAFNVISNTDIVYRELLAGTGVTVQVWDRDLWDDPESGLLLLLQYRSLKYEDELSASGTCELIIGPEYIGASWLQKDNILRFIVEGVERFACYIEDFIETTINQEESPSVRIVGRGLGKCLEWGTICPQGWPDAGYNVERAWTLKTRGYVLNELLDEIHSRGTLLQVSRDGWNSEVASNGQTWPDLLDLEFKAGSTYGKLLEDWNEYGVEWRMGPQFNLLLAPYLGRDLHETIYLYPLNTIKNQESTYIRRDIRTKFYLEDSNSGVATIQDNDAIAKWGQRELYQVFSEAVGAGTATSIGYALMDLVKDQVVERRVKIDPLVDGRRPFVDFDIGDTVTVVFGPEVKLEFRVLAIALEVDENGQLTAEVTLDFILEAQRKRRQRLLEGQGGGGTSSGPQMTYSLGGGFVVTTSLLGVLPLSITAFRSTIGKLGFTMIGTSSVNQVLKVEAMYSATVLETFEYSLLAGKNTVEITWLWTEIPQGTVPMQLRVSTDVGTFTVADTKAQFWIEAKAIAGKQSVAPVIDVTEVVPEILVPGVTDIVDLPVLTTMAGTPDYEEDVPELEEPTVTESTPDGWLLLRTWPAGATDDGWADTTTFTSTGSTARAGNQTAASGAFFRFPITVNLTGRTIRDAWLQVVTNAASTEVLLELGAVASSNPVAPTTLAEFNALTQTTERRDWSIIPTAAGTFRSPSIKNIIEELQTSYGTMSNILILAKNDGTTLGRSADFRTQESGSPVMLMIEFE